MTASGDDGWPFPLELRRRGTTAKKDGICSQTRCSCDTQEKKNTFCLYTDAAWDSANSSTITDGWVHQPEEKGLPDSANIRPEQAELATVAEAVQEI